MLTVRDVRLAWGEAKGREAAERLFRDVLGWQDEAGALGRAGTVIAAWHDDPRALEAHVLASAGRNGATELRYEGRSGKSCLRVHAVASRDAALERLILLREAVGDASPVERVERAFDPHDLGRAFMRDYVRVFNRALPDVRVTTFRGKPLTKPMSDVDARPFLTRFLNRVLLVAMTEEREWFRFNGRVDYLRALLEDYRDHPGPYRFQQRLGLVFFSALNQPSPAARALLRTQAGDVPYLGSGLFAAELFEDEFVTPEGVGLVPESLFDDLIGPNGIFNRYEFKLCDASSDERDVAVTAETLGAVFDELASVATGPSTAALRHRCRMELATYLECDPALSPIDRAWATRLTALQVHDPSCGAGAYLVAMVAELTRLQSVALGLPAAKVARDIVEKQLSGRDADDLNVQRARVRLALAVLSFDEGACPLPLPDLRRTVLVGVPLAASEAMAMREDRHTEFKSTYEWNSRRGARDPQHKFASLKTVAAFLNSEGGSLFIGVDDAGHAIGIAEDLSVVAERGSIDAFEGRLREALKNHIDPVPLGYVDVAFITLEGNTVARVDVRARAGVSYLLRKDDSGRVVEELFVRDGNRTLSLTGRLRDQFVLARSSNDGPELR